MQQTMGEKMGKEIIQDLINRAEELDEVDISEENLIEVDLLDFTNSPGEGIYYFDGYLYKESEKDKKWFKTKIDLSGEEGSQIEKLRESLSKSIEWCGKFKKYVDKKFKEVEDNQEETLKQLKEYIDNKTKGR